MWHDALPTSILSTLLSAAPRAAERPRVMQGDYAASVEPLLLVLGAVMTLVVGGFLVWLVRQMVREDRQARADGTYDERGGA